MYLYRQRARADLLAIFRCLHTKNQNKAKTKFKQCEMKQLRAMGSQELSVVLPNGLETQSIQNAFYTY